MLLLEHDVRYSQWWCKRLDEREHLAVCAERVVPSAHLALSPRAEIVPSPVPRPRQPRRRQHLAAGAHARGSRIDINTAHHCSVPGYDARQFAWVVTVYLEILTGKSRGKPLRCIDCLKTTRPSGLSIVGTVVESDGSNTLWPVIASCVVMNR
jgi:hypothetical protein